MPAYNLPSVHIIKMRTTNVSEKTKQSQRSFHLDQGGENSNNRTSTKKVLLILIPSFPLTPKHPQVRTTGARERKGREEKRKEEN